MIIEVDLWIFETTGHYYVRFEVSTAVTMKNTISYYETPCGHCKNRCLGGHYRLHHQGGKNQRARNNVASISLIFPVWWRYSSSGESSNEDSPIYTVTYAVVRRYSSSSLSTMRSEGHCRLSLRLTCSGLLNSVTWLFSCRISRLGYMVEYFFISSVTNGIDRHLSAKI
jgi:hypothetical protein